jgi:xylulokinase
VDAACQATVKQTGSTTPQPEAVARYEPCYESYRQLYPALKAISHQLSEQ